MSELHINTIIDDYLKGSLNPEEIQAFEELCRNNPEINQKVQDQKSFLEVLKDYQQRLDLKQQMNHVHGQIDVDSLSAELKPRTSRVIRLWRYNRTALAFAASLFVLAFVTLYSLKSSTVSYEAMRRDLIKVQRSQNNLIRDIKTNQIPNAKDPGRYGGSGFALSSNGYICTNYHVINGADSIYVQNNKGESFKVRTVWSDPQNDIAVLKIIDAGFLNLPRLPYALKTGIVGLGEVVYTLGFPKDDAVLGEGYVSSKSGFSGDTTLAYQVSIPVNPGNSGGPLLDDNGNIIGMISGKESQADGAAFAIKSKFLLDALRSIPQDSLTNKIAAAKRTQLSGLKRTRQIEKIQDYVFMVRVYN